MRLSKNDRAYCLPTLIEVKNQGWVIIILVVGVEDHQERCVGMVELTQGGISHSQKHVKGLNIGVNLTNKIDSQSGICGKNQIYILGYFRTQKEKKCCDHVSHIYFNSMMSHPYLIMV